MKTRRYVVEIPARWFRSRRVTFEIRETSVGHVLIIDGTIHALPDEPESGETP